MPSTAEYHTIRCAFDMARPYTDVVDKLTGQTPIFWRGNDLRFEVVVMRNNTVLDVSNLASLTLEVRDDQSITSTPLMQKTVAGGAMDNTVTDTTWGNNTKQHATFDFTDAETNLASPGAVFKSTWEDVKYLVLSGITNSGNVITYQCGPIIFREDGAGSAGTPPTNDPNYYTQAQTDAAFVAKAGATMTGLLVLSGDPVNVLGAATKQYVDAITANGAWKKPVRVASTANVTIASPGSAIDGVTLSANDRVLLKDQSTAADNGIYLFNGAASAMTRAGDCNSSALCEPGFTVHVNEGTVNADRKFTLTTNATITLGATSLTFTQVSALGQVTPPTGTTKTSNEVLDWHASVHATPAGVSINTAGTAGAPSVTRVGDLNTGLFFPAADTVAAATGGTERLRITDTGLGVHMTPTKALDVTGEAEFTNRVRAMAFETGTPGIQVLDAQVATISSNNLPFPNDGQILLVGAGTVNTVSNVRAGALYLIVATGAVTLTDSSTVVCRDGNVVLAADEAVMAVGLSPTKVAIVGQTNGHRVASGSAAAPSIFFDAETTTGLFRSAAGILGFAVSGTERMKLGIVSNNVEQIIPTYNFVIDPVDTTAGRGNLGLFGQRTFDGTGKQVLAWKSGTAPAAILADAVEMWVADQGAAPGEASLHVLTEGGDRHVLGGVVSLFDPNDWSNQDTGYPFAVYGGGLFENTLTVAVAVRTYSTTASNCGTIRLQRSRGSRATPAAVQVGDSIGSVEFNGGDATTFYPCATIEAKAMENHNNASTIHGSTLSFNVHSPGSSGAIAQALLIDANRNFLFGGSTAPTALVRGHVIGDGTAASADPTSAVALWSASGALQYRTSGANEGAGQTNHIHNRAAQVIGSGTDYNITASTARVDFGTTDAEVTLPTAGTYLVTAEVCIVDGAGATDYFLAKFYNSTDAAEVAGSLREVGAASASQKLMIPLAALITVTASKTIQIYIHNGVAARGTVTAAETAIRYVRLY